MKSVDNFVRTVAKLESPDGCPWDKEQSHKTLKRYLIEEAYEAVDAIENNDIKALMEELGDVLLQVVLHAQIAKENKKFSFDDLVNRINRKMISRHPHVFGNKKVKNTNEVLINWEKLKKAEKPERKTIFHGIPKSLPALLKALKVSKKASRAGFDWDTKSSIWKSFKSEFREFEAAAAKGNKNKKVEELGDLLFMVVNIARWYKLEPEECLNKGIKKFINRYNKVEKLLSGKDKNKISAKKLNLLWEKVKRLEKKQS